MAAQDKVSNLFRGLLNASPKKPAKKPANAPDSTVQNQPSFTPTVAEKSDEELRNSIPPEFRQEDFDATLYVLEHLPSDLTIEAIEREINNRERTMDLIDSELSDVIVHNYKSFVQGMNRVQEFGADLQATTALLRKGRIHLQNAKGDLTGGGMQIVTKAHKNQALTSLYDEINGVKQILTNTQQMEKALAEADYPLAIELCVRCQQDLTKYRQWQSVKDLATKNSESFESIEDKLEVSLMDSCRKFNPNVYEKTLIGFKLIGKSFRVAEVIQKHFSDLVESISQEVVLGFALSSVAGDPKARPDSLKSKQFKDLCTMLREDVEYIPCLRVLLEVECNLMLNLFAIMNWHDHATAAGESNKYFTEIKSKLSRCRRNLWDDIQRRIGSYISAKPLSGFKFEDFLTVLNLINKVINIGDSFTGDQSPLLRSTVKRHAELYFATSHRSRMEDLKTMLENESWHPCPLQPDFSIYRMREYDFSRNVALPSSLSESNDPSTNTGSMNEALFKEMLQKGGFSFTEEESQSLAEKPKGKLIQTVSVNKAPTNTAANDSSDDESEDLRKDFVDEGTDEKPQGHKGHKQARSSVWRDDESVNATVRARKHANADQANGGPILASTTVNVVRMLGRYISMAEVLSPIAYEVLSGLSQLIEYYLYAVFKFFATDVRSAAELLNGVDPALGSRLRTTLVRLRERYDERPADAVSLQDAASTESVLDHKFMTPRMSPVVDLKNPNLLFGLSNRITANESILYLENVLRACREKLESLIPSTRKAFLSQFYSQTVDIIGDLRTYVYRCIARRLINMDTVLTLMSKVDWDMKDLGTNTSGYIDMLLKEFLQFRTRLETDQALIGTPTSVLEILWALVITHSIETLVDGYSRVKKFSNEGRAQMQIDFASFQKGLQHLTTIRPIPHINFMDNFIKAYYLPEKEFEKWFMDHRHEYTPKQLTSIVSTNINLNLAKNSALRKAYQKQIDEKR